MAKYGGTGPQALMYAVEYQERHVRSIYLTMYLYSSGFFLLLVCKPDGTL